MNKSSNQFQKVLIGELARIQALVEALHGFAVAGATRGRPDTETGEGIRLADQSMQKRQMEIEQELSILAFGEPGLKATGRKKRNLPEQAGPSGKAANPAPQPPKRPRKQPTAKYRKQRTKI